MLYCFYHPPSTDAILCIMYERLSNLATKQILLISFCNNATCSSRHAFSSLVSYQQNQRQHSSFHPSSFGRRHYQKLLQNKILDPKNPVQLFMKICLLIVSFNKEARLAYMCFAVKTLPNVAANKKCQQKAQHGVSHLPMGRALRMILWLPRVYSMSTVIGAE